MGGDEIDVVDIPRLGADSSGRAFEERAGIKIDFICAYFGFDLEV